MTAEPTLRRVSPADREQWAELFDDYRRGAGLEVDASVTDRLWGWILDESNPIRAVVADDEGVLLGFAHFRPFPRPIMADEGLYLDDLFTRPEARGRGIARAILEHLVTVTAGGDYSSLRWTTRSKNTAARKLYDRLGVVSDAVVYNAVPDQPHFR